MTKLFLNNTEILLSSAMSFTMTRENPYFTGSSEFSEEIEIPLIGKNKNFFKHVNRLDVSKNKVNFDYRLIVDNRCVSSGVATTMSISKNSIKIQLLGGNSAVNFKSKYENLYIDQLDLGGIYDDFPVIFNGNPIRTNKDFNEFLKSKLEEWNESWYNTVYLNYASVYGFTLMPAIDDDGIAINKPTYYYSYNILLHSGRIYHNVYKQITHGVNPIGYDNTIIAQPMYWKIIERVCKAIGYDLNLDNEPMFDDWRDRIYLPNVTPTENLADMLPHWTVKEFFDEIEKFFGIIFDFDSSNNEIINKNVYFASLDVIHLNSVSDDFEFDFDEDNQEDMSGSNVEFAEVADNILRLPDTAKDNAIYEHYESFEMLKSSMINDLTFFGNEATRVIAECGDGRYFCKYDGTLIECDQEGPYKVNDSSENITLKICPPGLEPIKYVAFQREEETVRWGEVANPYDKMTADVEFMAPATSCYGMYIDKYTVQELIEGAQPKSKPDIMHACLLGWFNTKRMLTFSDGYDIFGKLDPTWVGCSISFNAIAATTSNTLGLTSFNGKALLRLKEIEGYETLYRCAIAAENQIRSQKTLKVEFYEDVTKLNRYFEIHGKLYMCEKIEQTISIDGINKKKTGYFYPLEESLKQEIPDKDIEEEK